MCFSRNAQWSPRFVSSGKDPVLPVSLAFDVPTGIGVVVVVVAAVAVVAATVVDVAVAAVVAVRSHDGFVGSVTAHTGSEWKEIHSETLATPVPKGPSTAIRAH